MTSRIGLSVGLLLVAGCQAPWIEGPSRYPRNPAAERESYTRHDPMPDSTMGPSVGGRPRESLIQRSEPRRSLEAAIPVMSNPQPPGLGGPQMMPPPQSAYPNAVAP